MFIPIGTDNPLQRRPTVNYLLIGLNVAVFIATLPFLHGDPTNPKVHAFQQFMLNPQSPLLHQFITYAFLHADWMHIIGNMFFLYMFGNNVNGKLGNIGYLLFYLGGAVFSGVGHVWLENNPVLGASGAVAAVTGAYMVLFPKTHINILYFFYFVGTTEIPALYFILLKLIVWDNALPKVMGSADNIARDAHLAGYAFGIILLLLMLALKIIPHSPFDLWAVFNRWRRRQQFQFMVADGYDPFQGTKPGRKRIFSRATNVNPHQEEIMALRAEINTALSANNLAQAVEKYLQVLCLDEKQVLPLQPQLDIANHLMQSSHHREAALAYELFLNHYPNYPFIEQVQLMLGLLYSRYLNHDDLARQNLNKALEKLQNTTQIQMARDELGRLD